MICLTTGSDSQHDAVVSGIIYNISEQGLTCDNWEGVSSLNDDMVIIRYSCYNALIHSSILDRD